MLHVLRCFVDDNVTHVEGGVDPRRDRDIVDTELCLKDLETVEKRRERAQKNAKVRGQGRRGGEGRAGAAGPGEGRPRRGHHRARAEALGDDEHERLRELFLLTDKPVLYVANIGEAQLGKEDSDPHVAQVRELAEAEGAEMVVLAAGIEAEIQQLPARGAPRLPRRAWA